MGHTAGGGGYKKGAGRVMEDYITRIEHNVFAEKIEAEDKRQNKRLDAMEDSIKQIQELTTQVKIMAASLERMTEELAKQGSRLESIEKEPAQNWKNAVWIVIAGVIGFALNMLLSGVGM